MCIVLHPTVRGHHHLCLRDFIQWSITYYTALIIIVLLNYYYRLNQSTFLNNPFIICAIYMITSSSSSNSISISSKNSRTSGSSSSGNSSGSNSIKKAQSKPTLNLRFFLQAFILLYTMQGAAKRKMGEASITNRPTPAKIVTA